MTTIDLSVFALRSVDGNVRLSCKKCGWEVKLSTSARDSLLTAARLAEEHVKDKRRLDGAYCATHRVRHDEQQASQSDRCIDCDRDRDEHRDQCRICGRHRTPSETVGWQGALFCSVACLAIAQRDGISDPDRRCA